ncbi:hypothetical protein H0H92_011391 [Tricholoma furcatifolium]|nr:hypothetical protein H0H92_011391 [Tricholoma furcatifolium]
MYRKPSASSFSNQLRNTLTDEELGGLLDQAEVSWPPPPTIPPTWSCTWSEWEHLLTYYWFSPLYLMLPRIELLVNIEYGIRGETRPVLFSNERKSFVFAIGSKYFLLDGPAKALYRVKNVRNDQELVDLLMQGDDELTLKLTAVERTDEGKAVMLRILKRDETVIPLLAEQFLTYTPTPTTPNMETNGAPESVEQAAEFLEDLRRNQSTTRNAVSERIQSAVDAEEKELRQLEEEFSRLLPETSGEHSEEENLKEKYEALLERVDGTIKEMEAFGPSAPNQPVYVDLLSTTKEIRQALNLDLNQLPSEMSPEVAYSLAMEFAVNVENNFKQIQNNPDVLNNIQIPKA